MCDGDRAGLSAPGLAQDDAKGGIPMPDEMLRQINTSIQDMSFKFKDLEAKVGTIHFGIASLQRDVRQSAAWKGEQTVPELKEPTATVEEDPDQVGPDSVLIDLDTLVEQSLSREQSWSNGANDIKGAQAAFSLLQAEQAALMREFQVFSKMPNQPDQADKTMVCAVDKIMDALESLSTRQESFRDEMRQLPGSNQARPRSSPKKIGGDTAAPPSPISRKTGNAAGEQAETPQSRSKSPKSKSPTSGRNSVNSSTPQTGAGAENEAETQVKRQTSEEAHQALRLRDSGAMGTVFGSDDDQDWDVPPYHVEDYYWDTGINARIARTDAFANVTVLVVVFNAIFIGFESDYNDAQNIYDAHWLFQLCSQFFCLYFTWELVVRFAAFRVKRDCLRDGWFKFDTFLVSTMILDIWMLMPTLYFVGGSVTVPTQPLRMLRLFKLTRMARLMKAFPELVTMIRGLFRSLRAIASSMVLIGLMVYVWGIMLHMLMKEEHEFNGIWWKKGMLGFRTLTLCMWTLLMDGTLMLDNSAPLMTELLFSDKFNFVLAGAAFLIYALLSAMLILQMLIGVLCDVVSKVSDEEDEALAVALIKQELLDTLLQYDGGDGKISQEELQMVMASPHSKALFRKLNINKQYLFVLQNTMFHSLAKDEEQQVTIKAIMDLMILCRGNTATTVEGMAGGILSIVSELQVMKEILERDMLALEVDLERDLEKQVSPRSPSRTEI